MTLLYVDGFEHYRTAEATGGLWAQFQGAVIVAPPVGGANGISGVARTGSRILFHGGGSASGDRLVLPGNRTRVGIGCAIWIEDLAVHRRLLRFFDATSVQCELYQDEMGALHVYRGTAGSVLLGSSANGVLLPGVWNHVEIWVTFSNTVGAVEVHLNEVEVAGLTLSNVDTCATANQFCNGVGINSNITLPNGGAAGYDDFFVCDDQGSFNNDFVGDYRVITLYPNGNTAEADWVANTGSAFDAINDAQTDEDTTYVAADAEGDLSEYDLEDLDAAYQDIAGAMSVVRARKTDAGTAAFQATIVSNGSDSAGANNGLTTAYAFYRDIHEVDPDTGDLWTRDAINAALLRIERTAP